MAAVRKLAATPAPAPPPAPFQPDLFGGPRTPPAPEPPPQPVERRGYFYCPFPCGNPRFPRPKWKTRAGAERHVAGCGQRPEVVAKRKAAEYRRSGELEKNRAAAIAVAPHKVGEVVHYWAERLVKSTHDRRGRRVRHEPVYAYEARSQEIESIGWEPGIGLHYTTRSGDRVKPSQIHPTIAEAHAHAERLQAAHNEALEFAAFCR